MYKNGFSVASYRGEGILATVVKDEWIDLIRLFFLRYGFVSRLLIAVIRPIFSEIEDTYDNISFVIVNGGLYSPTKHLQDFRYLAHYLAHFFAYFLLRLYKYDNTNIKQFQILYV